MFGQSIGGLIVGFECCLCTWLYNPKQNGFITPIPDVYIDTMGVSFSYIPAKLCNCKVITYTHYPTISAVSWYIRRYIYIYVYMYIIRLYVLTLNTIHTIYTIHNIYTLCSYTHYAHIHIHYTLYTIYTHYSLFSYTLYTIHTHHTIHRTC